MNFRLFFAGLLFFASPWAHAQDSTGCNVYTLYVSAVSTCEVTAGGGVIYEVGSIIDTFSYGSLTSQWGKDTLALQTTTPIDIIGYLDFGASDDCLHAYVTITPLPPQEVWKDTLFCGSGKIDSLVFTTDTFYTQYTVNEEGCLLNIHWAVTIAPLPYIEATLPAVVCSGETLQFTISSDGQITVSSPTGWQAVGGSISLVPSLMQTGENTIQVLTENDAGCMHDTLLSWEVADCNIYFPNAISPNGDGINDIFIPQAEEGIVSEIVSMIIYGEWGEFVWQNQHFPPNDPTQGWNGTFRDQPFHIDVVVYYAIVKFFDGSIRSYKGDVTLLR